MTPAEATPEVRTCECGDTFIPVAPSDHRCQHCWAELEREARANEEP